MRLILAPMEGVVDHHIRHMLGELGGYSLFVTEFVRVTSQLLPERLFLRLCPELKNGGETLNGIPVVVQLLGGDPAAMAENAAKVAGMGAPGIDLNFGCPAKKVTSKEGGSVLLKEPERIQQIVAAVRKAVDPELPVTAKMRLGYEDTSRTLEIAAAIEEAGASALVVHARTKVDGYRHPARWEWFAQIRESLSIPVIANGDIDSVESFFRCVQESGCEQMMLGRGALARPGLASDILLAMEGKQGESVDWIRARGMLLQLIDSMEREQLEQQKIAGRVKQWLVYLREGYPEAERLFTEVRSIKEIANIRAVL